jgi:hypothetical protein
MGILKVIGITAGVLLAGGVAATLLSPKPEPRVKTETEKANEAASLQIGAAVKALKAAAKNPESFKLDQVLAMDDGAGCITYRASNSFGALVAGQAVFAGGKVVTSDREASAFSRSHDRHCGGKNGRDITAYTRQFL